MAGHDDLRGPCRSQGRGCLEASLPVLTGASCNRRLYLFQEQSCVHKVLHEPSLDGAAGHPAVPGPHHLQLEDLPQVPPHQGQVLEKQQQQFTGEKKHWD